MNPYQAVVVDETQDWHQEELKLIRQLVPQGPNDLFLVGDAHQRIYGQPVILGRCGIEIRGRSRKLRINYRTTEEIRNWAVDVLSDDSIDDLDGGYDQHDNYRSLLHGDEPSIASFDSLNAEKKYLLEQVNRLLEIGVEPESICLVARTKRLLEEDYIPELLRAEIPHLYLQRDTQEDTDAGVRVATMHRVKGLTFAHMLIAGANDGVLPYVAEWADEEDEGGDSELQERCLLHVAATRARDTLTITSYGVMSQLVTGDSK